ncbi:MAG: C10 family peptidase, partial [Candidatus Cloacimonadota bacterium]|nr:C10 family peptidase [Candidatus Cloacimonadota bacterium]
MKKLLVIVFVLFLFVMLNAEKVSIENAEKIALNWEENWNNQKNFSNKIINAKATIQKNTPLFFTFSFENRGFVIVAADNNIVPILGYSFKSSIEKQITNPSLKLFLDKLSEEAFRVISENIQNVEAQTKWSEIYNNDFSRYETRDVSPLLQTEWDQGQYYNEECPSDADGPGGHVYAGCVATAMGQCMKYWNYPDNGVGNHSYYHSDYGTLSANFGNTTYNWNSMPNAIYGQDYDVANLLSHLGISVDMNYSPNGSGAYSEDARNALVNFFQYSNSAQLVWKDDYTNAQWENVLKTELDGGRPMYYRGQSDDGGHAFVCDGYQASNYFHFNWGWSGYYNGYFYTSSLTPGDHSFNDWQGAIIGLEPANIDPPDPD